MFQTFRIDNLDKFPDDLKKLLNTQSLKINKISTNDKISYKSISKPIQEMNEKLSLFFTPLSHLNSVMNSKKTQKAYEDSIPLLSKFDSEMAQNEALFKKIENIPLQNENEEVKKVIENDIRDFMLSGIKLPEKEKKRLEEINLKLSELSNNFSQNLLDATGEYELLIGDIKDVKGMPEADIEAAKSIADDKVMYKFTLQVPSYISYMTYGPNRAYRQELSRAYSTRAPQNAEIIDKILLLRQEKSNLLGFQNYAEYALQTRDASSQDEVLSFLNELSDAAMPHAKKELKELQTFAKNIDGIELESYDITYYSQKLKKKKFDFDDTMTKPYFQQSKVLEGLLKIVSELFEVSFKAIDVPTWHECVKVFDVYEEDKLKSRIYFDLEARKEKRGGAWMNDWETHFVDSDNHEHLPSAFVTCNFSPASSNIPSLLRHDDIVTLFHETGHAIHHLFSKVNERAISGINGVAWDVVEFPSQFLENFAYERSILKQFSFHYKDHTPMPNDLLRKIKKSKNFQASLGILRQVEFSLFDFRLHQKLYQGVEVQTLLDDVRKKVALVQVPKYNRFQNGFSHIFAGGYGAGYYSYKWAEVLSADAFFECLNEKNDILKEKALGYKKHILAKGASDRMSNLYTNWLNKKNDIKNLLKLYEI